MTRRLTDKSIAALTVTKRTTIADPKLAGHYVRVTPNGAKTFVAVARDPRGNQVWHTIGACDLYTLDQARDLARDAMKAIKLGADRAGPQSFQAVAEEWLKRHVEAKGLITAKERKRYLTKHILPEWAGRDFTDQAQRHRQAARQDRGQRWPDLCGFCSRRYPLDLQFLCEPK